MRHSSFYLILEPLENGKTRILCSAGSNKGSKDLNDELVSDFLEFIRK
jgi:hypothetical protein